MIARLATIRHVSVIELCHIRTVHDYELLLIAI